MEYSKVRLKGYVDTDIRLHCDGRRNGLLFYLLPSIGNYRGLDPICCVAFGEDAETVLQASMKGNQIVLEGSFYSDTFRDQKKRRYYEMTYISVESAYVDGEKGGPVRKATATGWLHEVKRHVDRDGYVYFTFLLSETQYYENGNFFRCYAPEGVGPALRKLYEENPWNRFRLDGFVSEAQKPCKKGKAMMYVHSFEML